MIPAWLGIPGLIVFGVFLSLAILIFGGVIVSSLIDLIDSIKTGRPEFSLKKTLKGLLFYIGVVIAVAICIVLACIGFKYFTQLLRH